ncbi:MAG TPA: cystathionine beta-lyase [Pyrinomonadaceae bacterium]|nr:cystathionine beta-lyase [Pyrinomonadaceae bacterium]
MKRSTRCVYLGTGADPYGAIVPPIYQTATFKQPTALEFGEYDYTRSGNPTRTLLEQQLASLEEGLHACAFASGLAAITALTRLIRSGEEIIAGDDLYGGTIRLLQRISGSQNITVRYIDTTDITAVERVLSPKTRLILIETPTNPLFHISDIRQLSQLARKSGALLAVDNSMLSPVFQQPLTLGADIVVHSATKFLCGHSDVTAGALITNSTPVHDAVSFHQNAEGSGLSPFEAWLLLRGLKTLALRVERQNQTALKIARFLEAHPSVSKVYYPGLQHHPGHTTHRSQAQGDGAVVSFTTGNAELSAAIAEATRLFQIAVSFGSVGSTISLPCRMSHASIPSSLKDRLAPPADLVRISVGIEDAEDLVDDLTQAFESIQEQAEKPQTLGMTA